MIAEDLGQGLTNVLEFLGVHFFNLKYVVSKR